MQNNPRKGILLMLAATFVLAVQDGMSRQLAEHYSVLAVVMIRYWFFAAFVLLWSHYRGGGIRAVAKSHFPLLQVLRGLILVAEVCILVSAFTLLGLVESHAAFACYPLIVVALSGPILGESIGWRRWSAVVVGFIGMLIVLRPGSAVFSFAALLPLVSALMFALYSLLTRYVSQQDRAETSFFWTGVSGVVAISLLGPFYWTPMQGDDRWLMAALCVTGVLGHFLLIKALEAAEASTIQPFAYFQLVFASAIGILIFAESLDSMVLLGGIIIVAAGLFTIWRSKQNAEADK